MNNSIDTKTRRRNAQIKKWQRYFIVLIIFLFFEYVRVQDSYLSFLAPLKIPALLSLYLLFVLYSNLNKLPKDRNINLMICLFVLMLVHIPFANNNYFAFNATKDMFLTYIVVFSSTIILYTIMTIKRLFTSLVYIVFLISVWTITHNGRGPGGFVADENDVCLFLVTGLPFCWYYCQLDGLGKLSRWVGITTVFITVIAIILTFSRGGFLGLVAVVGMIIVFSRKPIKNALLALLLAGLLGGVTLHFLPAGYVADMETITDQQNSTRNLRFLHWTTAWEIFKDNPLVGVGPQNYPWASGDYFHLSPYYVEGARGRSGRLSHSLYFTLIPELGLVGIVIFVLLTFSFYKRGLYVRSIIKKSHFSDESLDKSGRSDIKTIMKFYTALLVGMTGFLVSAAFVSALYYPIYWNLIGFAIATWWIFLKSEPPTRINQGKVTTGIR